MRPFTRGEERIGGVVTAEQAGSFDVKPPFALFMRREIWNEHGAALRARYAEARVRNVTPDGRLVVLEAT